MTDTKFGPLASLVGRTFERDGKRKEFGARFTIDSIAYTNVYDVDEQGAAFGVSMWTGEAVSAFLSGAVEVKDDTDRGVRN